MMRIGENCRRRVMENAKAIALVNRSFCLGLEREDPLRTAGNEKQASTVTRAGDGDRQRPKKLIPSLL
jgi:hypothetical protein